MAEKDTADDLDPEEKTIKTAGRIVKYSREIYHLESVSDVATMTLEATPHFIEGYPEPTVIEIRTDDLRVLESMQPSVFPGDDPAEIVRMAYDTGQIIVSAGPEVTVAYDGDEVEILMGTDRLGETGEEVTIAAPTIYTDGEGDSGAVLQVYWPSLPRVEQYHVKPVAYLAEHVATAIVNIRSHERLELARNDLQTRKDMLEVYDRLLRHDLGNDLQIINGFSDIVQSLLDESHDAYEYVEKINDTSMASIELIDRVGDTVKTLEKEEELEVKALEPIVTNAVEAVETKFETLAIEYDPDEFDYEVYAGDLIDSVFMNVLSNAAVHNDGDIVVKVTSETPTQDAVVVSMADDGSGVPEEIRDEIFEMGQKGPESEGTGFGLGLTRTLVESYGGGVEVIDSEFDGADFRIRLQRP